MSTSEKERFIGILRDHKGILAKIIRSYCGNPDDWKDLEQEIIIQLWKSLKHYNPAYKLSTWIYRIALNVAISHYRKERKRKNDTPLDSAIFLLTDEDAEEERSAQIQLLYAFINTLDELDKALIILHLEDNSHREIAGILGITETNVGTKLNRVKKKLRVSFTSISNQ